MMPLTRRDPKQAGWLRQEVEQWLRGAGGGHAEIVWNTYAFSLGR